MTPSQLFFAAVLDEFGSYVNDGWDASAGKLPKVGAAGGDPRPGAAHGVDQRQRILGRPVATPSDVPVGPHQHQRAP